MRTQNEIAERVKNDKRDILGFAAEVLLPFLDFEHARPFLKPEATPASWAEVTRPIAEDEVKAQMRDYMAFAWGKVKDHRGISAGRSVQKMGAWLWVLGDDELAKACDDETDYAPYGAPILKRISERYGFPIPETQTVQRMASGRPCVDDCKEGCC